MPLFKIEPIELKEIRTEQKYIATQYNVLNGAIDMYTGKGHQLIKKLKEIFSYDDWLKDMNYTDGALSKKEFLSYCDDRNIDIGNFIEVFKKQDI